MSKIARNTTYLTAAYVFQKATAFVYFALIARHFGVDLLGKYTFSVFFVMLLSILIDLGLNQVLTREIAKYPEKTNEYFDNIFSFKILLGIVVYGLAIFLVYVLGYPQITKNLVMITGVIMFFDGLTQTMHATMRGHQNLKYESIGTVIYQTVEIGIGACVLLFHWPIYGLAIAILGGSLGNFTYTISRIVNVFKVKIGILFEKAVIKNLLRLAAPFFIAGVFIKVYSHIDSVLLTKLAGDAAMGFYSVPYKLVFSLQVLPMAFGASVYPAFSHYWLKSRELLKNTFEKSFFYLMVTVLPITFRTIALADQIIVKVYSNQYEPSILALKILIISAFFSFLTFPIGALLNACDRQKTNTRNIGIVMVINIVLNLILIPRLSFVGASIAALCSQVLLFTLGLAYVSGIIHYDKKYLGWSFIKIVLASAVMGGLAYLVKDQVHVVFNIAIAGLVYIGMIMVSATVSKSDIKEMLRLAKFKKMDKI
ncbi:flippase [Patescibacteria group bacterium]|nr:flippase [Patescibacteria group bacterium]